MDPRIMLQDYELLQMGNAFKEVLRNHHVPLKETLNVDGELLDHLYQERVFTDAEDEKCRSKCTQEERCQFLLSKLRVKGLREYKIFCKILAKKQPSVKECLDNQAVSMGLDGLVFESGAKLDAEYNEKLARKDKEISQLLEDNVKKKKEIDHLKEGLRLQYNLLREEIDTVNKKLSQSNKENRDYRIRQQMVLKGIGDQGYWLKNSNEEEQILLCPNFSMNRISLAIGEKMRISKFNQAWVPFNLEVLQYPIYLETEAEVELHPMMVFGPRLLELGFYEEGPGDACDVEHQQSPTWGICVELCPVHYFQVCTQIWGDTKHQMCFSSKMPNIQGTKATLKFGIVMDVNRGKLGFISITRENGYGMGDMVLGKFDVDLKECFYQFFVAGAKPDSGANVDVKLTTGYDIVMDRHKQTLILQALH